ncbi:MAG: ATP-binding protein, partial [Spirochaetia bacterium]
MLEPEKATTTPDMFYGRKTIVRRIFSRVGADRPQSVAVIGGRKIGKTSLLNHIHHPEVRGDFLEDTQGFIFLKINLKDEGYGDADGFLADVYRQLTGGDAKGQNWYTVIQKYVEETHNSGKKLIFLLDDFHYITRNQNFPLEFFSFLRSLANNYNLAYVTTSYLELQKLCIAKDIEESPFFNIFTNLALGMLSSQTALELCRDLTGWEEAQAGELVRWCGPLPYALKIAVKKINSSASPSPDGFEKLLLPELKGYFEEILSILPKDAFKPLRELAKGKSPDPRDIHLLQPLIRQNFLTEDA